MSKPQEQAAVAARRACIAWLRSATDTRKSSVAAHDGFVEFADAHQAITNPRYYNVKTAYLAAWKLTWDSAS